MGMAVNSLQKQPVRQRQSGNPAGGALTGRLWGTEPDLDLIKQEEQA
jgi:hypothetical protein